MTHTPQILWFERASLRKFHQARYDKCAGASLQLHADDRATAWWKLLKKLSLRIKIHLVHRRLDQIMKDMVRVDPTPLGLEVR